jgi:flavin-dependent dehydrogenase
MDRYAFDQWLLSLVPSRVTVCKGRCRSIKKENGLCHISIKQSDGEVQVYAKALVGADGGGSVVRRTFFTPVRVQYVAIQQWFENSGQKLPYYSCIFDEKTSDSCSWTIHKGNYILFGGAFERKGCRQAFETQKARLESFLGNSFGDAVKTEACLVSSPRTTADFCTGKDNIFLLGEAAGFISASSFEGISSAVLSARLLAEAFAEGYDTDRVLLIYRQKTRKLRGKLRGKMQKRRVLCSPFLRWCIMKSGVQSMKKYHTPPQKRK